MAGSPASSTGLAPKSGALLAYLAWWVTGALMLLLERRDRYVRFHAAQALVGLGGLWLIGALVYAAAFGLLSVTAAGFIATLWLAQGIWAAGVGVWLVGLVRVSRGEDWRLPWVAGIAEKLAGSDERS